jgi:hypothetical protein
MHKLAIRMALFFLLLPTTVGTLEKLHLNSVSVDIWPEYDQQAVLVIERFSLAADTSLPFIITTHVPSGVQINAIAVEDPTKGLINAPYENSIQGSLSELRITSISLHVQVEYYEALKKNGSTRQIIYEWPADNDLDTLEINFLLPPSANNVEIEPPPINTSLEQGGLTNYLIRAINPPTGKPLVVTMNYDRKTDELGIASLPVGAFTTPGTDTPGRAITPFPLHWALGGIGFLLVLISGIGIYRWRREQRIPIGRSSRILDQADSRGIVYCGKCGKRAQAGDVFCRTCGARIAHGPKA